MEECKCPHCGSKDFYVHEFEYWKASVDEDEPNTINCFHKSSGTVPLSCKQKNRIFKGSDISEEAYRYSHNRVMLQLF